MSEGFVSRGFRGRRKPGDESGRIPPGQYLERGFPVLSAGPTPHTPLATWDFSLLGEVDQPKRWTWDAFRALPHEMVTKDIHCVTKWSKRDTHWEGVSVDTLLEQVEYDANYVIAFSDGGYTTNLPLEDVLDGKAWVVYAYDGQPLTPNTVDQHACWFPTSTSGRAPSGSEVCDWSIGMNRASGSRLATIITVIHGKKNDTGATKLAAWRGGCDAGRNSAGEEYYTRRSSLEGASTRTACGCTTHG
ncbi:hypothetical protein KSB_75140 [Ktedonobacter robiniae]|uniref:Oxidoreductase molybdopterin-binding domain-containing protein n=1 Tax=Ktedonobacter robiniae TaxID=2778365 RepID=A0ABQ3V1L5_9CHLR|nr:hypothetical protein KSB_75140 [Ktedonobacter robiniae]